jgi:PAS domain-containing protein
LTRFLDANRFAFRVKSEAAAGTGPAWLRPDFVICLKWTRRAKYARIAAASKSQLRPGDLGVQRFVCEQNIAHFEKLLETAQEPALRHTLEGLLVSAKRELAILESALSGAGESPIEAQRRQRGDAQTIRQQFQPEFDASPHPYMLLDPGPGLHIVDINDAYARATLTNRNEVAGRSLFEIFPDNPDDPLADGVSNLYASLRTVVRTGQPHAMAVQRYDIRDPFGKFVERYWQPVNSPIHDRDGVLIYILNHVEDVTGDAAAPARPDVSSQRHPDHPQSPFR